MRWTQVLCTVLAAGAAAALSFVGAVPSATAAAASSGGTLVVAMPAASTTLDPAVGGSENDAQIYGSLYDPLVSFKPDTLELAPTGLATSWSESKNGLVYTLQLRKGVKFQDGTPFNAQAVVFDFERQIDPKDPYYQSSFYLAKLQMPYLTKVVATSPYTVEFILSHRDASTISNLTMFDAYMVSPAAVKKWGKNYTDHPVGTGPFEFVSWNKNTGIVVMKRNPDYWGGAPKLAKLEFVPIGDSSAAVSALESHTVDFVVSPPAQDLTSLKQAGYTVETVEAPMSQWLTLNTSWGPFKNVDVRRALNDAVDKQAIVKDVLLGTAAPAVGPLPPSMPLTDKSLKGYTYNPAAAEKLLQKAGYGNGFSFTLSTWNAPSVVAIATMIQAQLAAVNIHVKIVQYDWGTYLSVYQSGKLQAGMMSWTMVTGDPDLLIPAVYENGTVWDNHYYDDPKMNQLVTDTLTAPTPAIRAKVYANLQVLAMSDAPWVFIDYPEAVVAMSSNVKGYVQWPDGLLRFNTTTISQ
jgi:peptide/nickel transport system substrate-binding protein